MPTDASDRADPSAYPPPGRMLRWWMHLLHLVGDWLCHRSPVRIGGALDRAAMAAIRRIRPTGTGSHSLTFTLVFRINRMLLPRLRGDLRCPTLLGFDLCVDERSGLYYYLLGCYERGTLDLIERALQPGDTAIDIGCSVGQMSLMAAGQVGDDGIVLSFDAAPYRVEQLRASVAISPHPNRVRPHHVALGDADGVAHIDVSRYSPALRPDSFQGETSEVPMRRLDDILAESGVAPPTLIKIDVEGAEEIVLSGAQATLTGPTPPIVCFEYGLDPEGAVDDGLLGNAVDVVALLERCGVGYRFFRFERGSLTSGQLVPVGDWSEVRYGHNVVACVAAHAERLPEIAPYV